jgi:hypothetical protein
MNETPTVPMPVFYACLPTTLDGPPFEIAWATLAFEACHGVVCESRLIRPPAAWTTELVRDPLPLVEYGLAVPDLQQFGMPVRELAEHMNKTFADRELFSATVSDDNRIKRIFDTAKIAPKFVLHITDADELIAELARLQRLPHEIAVRARREAEVMCLTGIRAEAKVRFLATYWGFIAWQN